ncbi:putative microtubule-associated protein [Golovinomyces cichoracearum]|uniref:Mediator of RNA polymerase II transcription subunit 9 n=1 Tax=Golovinomyces cichoracearum TaxID=62708 RepID=A0A420J4N8_9PEZI|nr:putative microtubule-associated protein [Golovinomyces cichoracearum]
MESSPITNSDDAPIIKLPEGLTPNSLDTIPVISSLLCRLQNSTSFNSNSTSGFQTASPSQHTAGTGPLSFKDIPPATDGLKHQLLKALSQIKQLPDMDRTIEEQEVEIKELEEKICRQRKVISELRQLGLTGKKKEPTDEANTHPTFETPQADM